MTHIDQENFNVINPIIRIGFDDDEDYIAPSFPCDDLMAPIVSELNKRGYCTSYSCQGHYFDYEEKLYDNGYYMTTKIVPSECKYTYPNVRFLPEVFLRLSKHISTLSLEWIAIVVSRKDADGYAPRDEFEIYPNNEYKFDNPYEFYAKMVELHKILYDWVCTLPTYPKCWDVFRLNEAARNPAGIARDSNWKDSVLFLSDEEMDIHKKDVEAQLVAQLAEYCKSYLAG